MKQQFQVLLRKEITKQQFIRAHFKQSEKFYMNISEVGDDITFNTLNFYRTKVRKVEAKLKKLRDLQKSLSSVDGFLCSGQIFDSQMNIVERRWKP